MCQSCLQRRHVTSAAAAVAIVDVDAAAPLANPSIAAPPLLSTSPVLPMVLPRHWSSPSLLPPPPCCRRSLPYRSFARQRHHLSHRRFAVDVTDAAAPLDAPPPYCSVGIVAIRHRRRSLPATAVPRRSRKAGQHLYCCSAVAVDISGATHGATAPLAGRLLRCYRHHRCCRRPLPYRSFARRPMLPHRWPPHLQTVSLLSCCCSLTPSPAVPRRSRKSAPLVRLVY